MESFDSAYLIAGLVFVVIFTLYMAVDATFGRREKLQHLEEKIAAVGGGGHREQIGIDDEKTPTAEMLEGILRGVGVDVAARAEAVKPQLQHAGMSSINAPIYLLFIKYVLRWVVVVAGLAIVVGGMQQGDDPALLLGLLVVCIGMFGADLYIANQRKRRNKRLARSFPDTLDLMVVCVESGLALDAALGRVCKELGRAHPEVTGELNRTRLEMALLNDRSIALQNLADRADLVPFRSLVAALIQTEKFGTSLTDTLRVLSEDYRQIRISVAEQKANRLSALMTIPLILLLMPAFMIVILGPPLIKVSAQGGIFGDSQETQGTR